jgi:hypothetical protein
MPSIRKQKIQKIQKRSRQQKRRVVISSDKKFDDRLPLEEERHQLEKERLQIEEEILQLESEKQRLIEEEERQRLEYSLKDYNKQELEEENLDYNRFDNGGAGSKKRGNKGSKPSHYPLNKPDEQINNEELPNLDREDSRVDLTLKGGCGMKKNMRPYPRSAAEKEEMRQIINQGLSSGEFKLDMVGPNGSQMVVNAQNGGSKPTQHRSVSLRTAVKLLKNYYTKRN